MNANGVTPVLVSACLLGANCTYEGGNESRMDLVLGLDAIAVIPICPEVAAGLGIPRPRCEVEGADGEGVLDARRAVRSSDGTDFTEPYLQGAQMAVAAAIRHGVRMAILKARSPSCGPHAIFDGTHAGILRPEGIGVTACALSRAGIDVVDEDEGLQRFVKHLRGRAGTVGGDYGDRSDRALSSDG